MNNRVARRIRKSKVVTSAKPSEQRRTYRSLKKGYISGKNKLEEF